jgi:spore germination protein (amino acid permease)
MIYRMLQKGNGDIVNIHKQVFGKYIGGLFSLILSLYFLLLSLTVVRTFIEVIQVWVFPRMNVWIFSLVFLLLAYYFSASGFRAVTGICMISVMLGIPILVLKFFPIEYAQVNHLFPVLNHTVPELIAATKTTTLSFLGIELLLIYYPFIKKPEASKKWAHHGVFYTTLIYLITAIVTFIYYSERGLTNLIWPTINLWKIVEFPFIERFEYVGIALWVYVILPNICLALWAASRIPKRVFRIKQRWVLSFYFILLYIASNMFNDRTTIDQLNTIAGKIGFYVLLYIPILFCLQFIIVKVWKQNER